MANKHYSDNIVKKKKKKVCFDSSGQTGKVNMASVIKSSTGVVIVKSEVPEPINLERIRIYCANFMEVTRGSDHGDSAKVILIYRTMSHFFSDGHKSSHKTSYEVFKGATGLCFSHIKALWNPINRKNNGQRDAETVGAYVTVLSDLSMDVHNCINVTSTLHQLQRSIS